MASKIFNYLLGKQNTQDPYDFSDLIGVLLAKPVGTAQASSSNMSNTTTPLLQSSQEVTQLNGDRLPVQGKITMNPGDPASWFAGGKHIGTDIAIPTGTPIPAVGSGKVIEAGENGNWGKTVLVQLTNGMKARYAHLNDINVKPGQEIKDNSIIGQSGSTGLSTGPHLHYQLTK